MGVAVGADVVCADAVADDACAEAEVGTGVPETWLIGVTAGVLVVCIMLVGSGVGVAVSTTEVTSGVAVGFSSGGSSVMVSMSDTGPSTCARDEEGCGC